MAWVGVVTDAGRSMYNRYSAEGLSINMSALKLGAGPVDQSTMRAMTDIVAEKDAGVIESKIITTTGTNFRLRANSASASVGSYTLKEMGLYATGTSSGQTETCLFAYMIETGSGIAIPLASSFPDFLFILSTTLVLDNTTELTFTIDPSAYASYLQLTDGLATKVDLDQGVANAGKFLVVGNDGIVVPVTVPFASGVSF